MVILSEGSPPCTAPGNGTGRPVQVGFYEVSRTLGRGNFAVVKLARHKVTKTQVAIKIIDKTKLSPADLEKVYREVRIMKLLKHPHIVKLYQVMETKDMLYMVLEYAKNGEMFDYLSGSGRLSEAEARRKFCQILAAVEYCHGNHIVHRDLKAENLLLDDNMDVKIADFGFGNFYAQGEALSTWCGSPPYAAPEVFEGKEHDGPPLDIWSLGVVLYVMVCGSLPFDAPTLPALRQRVVEGRFRIPFFMSQDCENLVRRMLSVDPHRRITVAQIKHHCWLQAEPSALQDLQGTPSQTPSQTISFTPEGEPGLGEYSEQVLGIMQTLGIDRYRTIESIQNNSYNHFSAIYCLLLERVSELRVRRLSLAPEELGLSPGPTRAAGLSHDRLESLGGEEEAEEERGGPEEEEEEEEEGVGGMQQATPPRRAVASSRRHSLAATPSNLRQRSPCVSEDSFDEDMSDSCPDSSSFHSSFRSSCRSSSSGSSSGSPPPPAQSPPLLLSPVAPASRAGRASDPRRGAALCPDLPAPRQDAPPVPNFEKGRRASDTSLTLDLRMFHQHLRRDVRTKGLQELNKIRVNVPRARQACPPGPSPLGSFMPARLPHLPQKSLLSRRVLQVPLQRFLPASKPPPLLYIPPPPSVTAPNPPPLRPPGDLRGSHLPPRQRLPPSPQQGLPPSSGLPPSPQQRLPPSGLPSPPPLTQPYYEACSEQPLDLSLPPASSASASSSSSSLVSSVAHLLETRLHISQQPEDLTQPRPPAAPAHQLPATGPAVRQVPRYGP